MLLSLKIYNFLNKDVFLIFNVKVNKMKILYLSLKVLLRILSTQVTKEL